MLAQTFIMAAFTAAAAAVALPSDPTASAPAAGLPHCRLDGRPNSCSPGDSCVDEYHGTCAWYYCQGGNLEKWIDCGSRGCIYQNGQPACN